MVWQFHDPWENGLSHARSYYEEHGNLLVPMTYVCQDDFALGSWIQNQRSNYANSDKKRIVTKAQKARLNGIGMVWNVASNR